MAMLTARATRSLHVPYLWPPTEVEAKQVGQVRGRLSTSLEGFYTLPRGSVLAWSISSAASERPTEFIELEHRLSGAFLPQGSPTQLRTAPPSKLMWVRKRV